MLLKPKIIGVSKTRALMEKGRSEFRDRFIRDLNWQIKYCTKKGRDHAFVFFNYSETTEEEIKKILKEELPSDYSYSYTNVTLDHRIQVKW